MNGNHPRPTRICFCIPSLAVGGTERRALLLANEGARRGYEVRLLAAHATDQPVGVALGGVDSHCLDRPRPFRRGGFGPLRRAIGEFAPDVYHGFLNVGCYFGVLAARIEHVPVVVSATTSTVGQLRRLGRSETWFSWFSTRRADAVTVNSRRTLAEYQSFLRVPSSRIEYIPSFVEAAAIPCRDAALRARYRADLGLAPDEPVLVTVATLRPEKALPDLIDALARLAAAGQRAHWLLVGDGRERASIAAAIAAAGVGDRVSMLGVRNDVIGLLQAADLFVLPSVTEGMSNALLEAMAAGLPAVATAISGSEDLVRPGESGWLVPPADPARLAAALAEALEAPPERLETLGRNARRQIEQEYDRPVVTDRYFALYERLLAARTGQSR